MANDRSRNIVNIPDSCPHCGKELSPWQKVLLSVDRGLMCKNCWYRIVVDVYPDEKDKKTQTPKTNSDDQDKESGLK